jgi:hypothetical protein
MPTVSSASDKRRPSVDVTSNKTLALADMGIVQNVRSSSAVITLPATAAGLSFTVRNGGTVVTNGPQGASGTAVTVAVSPNASDYVAGNGFTATDNKDALNTNGQVGDEITLVADGTNGYYIAEQFGTWTREA